MDYVYIFRNIIKCILRSLHRHEDLIKDKFNVEVSIALFLLLTYHKIPIEQFKPNYFFQSMQKNTLICFLNVDV